MFVHLLHIKTDHFLIVLEKKILSEDFVSEIITFFQRFGRTLISQLLHISYEAA